MKIETKFDVGDSVVVFTDVGVKSYIVSGVFFRKCHDSCEISYNLKFREADETWFPFTESRVFKSREELADAIQKRLI